LRPIDVALNRLKSVYVPGPGRASEDPEPDLTDSTDADAGGELPADLVWPPPGLEHIHGLLPRVTIELTFAAILLIAPVALGQWRDWPPESGSWGSVVVMMVVGVLLFATWIRVMILFNRATSGVQAGYPRQLVWHVAADSWRNTPEILRGRFAFERLGVAARTAILDARAAASLLALGAAVWLATTFPFWLLLGVTGRINARSVWIAALLPAALLLAGSLFFRWRELRAFYGNRIQDEEDRHAAQQARGWRDLYRRAGYDLTTADAGARYRLASVAAVFSIFLIFIPLVLAAFTMVIPQLVQSNARSYPMTIRRAALDALQAYRLPVDTTIMPLAAGEAFHSIVMAGSASRSPSLKAARVHSQDSALAVLGRARAMDYAGARWNLDVTGTVPPWRIEPAAHRFQEAATRHARAHADETSLREIIGAGFLVADDALTVWDAQTGQTVVQVGAAALADLYDRTGRVAEAAQIRGVLSTASAATIATLRSVRETRATMRGLRLAVVGTQVPRAVRWDIFTGLSTTARCGSLPALVFGPGERDKEFARHAHDALVRFPADERYFEIVSRGYTETMGTAKGSCNLGWVRDALRGYR
jgi:hypothetical protein